MNIGYYKVLATAIVLGLLAQSLNGDTEEPPKFGISLGVFITDRDTQTSSNSSIGVGSNTDFEKDLGFDASDTVFRIDGYYRFNQRHRLNFSAFDLSRSAVAQIQKDIQWGDTLYPIDTEVKSNLDLAIYKLAYSYTIKQTQDSYVGVTAGLYTMDVGFKIEEQTLGSAEIDNITAPLPVIGFRGDHQLNKHWSLHGSAEFFFVEFDNVKGSLIDLYAGIEYRIQKNTSIGLGFNSVNINVDVIENNFSGELDWQYTGGLLFVKFEY